MSEVLTVLTVSPWETTEANTLIGVQHGVAAAAVVAGLMGTRVVLEHGYVAGAQGVLLSEDGGTHQNDLEAGNKELKGHAEDFSRTWGYTQKVKLLVMFSTVCKIVYCVLWGVF